ncbi:hypothetical protein [Candidatus Vampirococcus lugosii]|uniref:Uncharacterized protein n=1 Tax=Candidatus Vampirococcus lugosii TaxID=2789015 RepID=A0ABS5QLF8_9BACT|nr:hypothetical protein [Candidatus Vampirococcus lugosii]MBS8121824.1 hypothetical protein [Candidatus Vampirococcus lugosii]
MSSSILKDLYDAYVNKDCNKMQNLLVSLEKEEPDSPYLKKYKQMYQNICKDSQGGEYSQREGKVKIGGKAIQCTSCGNYLRMNENVKKIYQDYKNGETKQLEFACESCGTKFVWQQHNIKSIFLDNVGVGKNIDIESRNYTISSVVNYKGEWKEGDELGGLEYNEYLLVDITGEINYLSESRAYWNVGKKDETELSWKIIPIFDIQEINSGYIKTNKGDITIDEINQVKVEKIYGENTKSYTIGEEVILYYFSYSGKDYILEKESSGTQKEVGIYERKKVYLNKYNEVSYSYEPLNNLLNLKDIKNNLIIISSIVVICLSLFLIRISPIISFLILIVTYCVLYIKFKIKNIKLYFVLNLILSALFAYLSLSFFIGPKEYSFKNQDNGNYKISFDKNNILKLPDGEKKYDYGGTKNKFKDISGIKFSIKTEEDKKILNEFEKYKNNINYFNNNDKKGDIYIGNKKYPYSGGIIKNYLLDNIKLNE